MNPKILKLKEEREKNCKKISALQARNKKLDEDILSLENSDILGVVREYNLTPEQLSELLLAMKTNPLPVLSEQNEEGASLEE